MKKYSAVLLILAMVLSFTVIACNPTVIVGKEVEMAGSFSAAELAVFSNTSTVPGSSAISNEGKTLLENAIDALASVPAAQRVLTSLKKYSELTDYIPVSEVFSVKSVSAEKTADSAVMSMQVKKGTGSSFIVTVHFNLSKGADLARIVWNGKTYTGTDIQNGNAPDDVIAFAGIVNNGIAFSESYFLEEKSITKESFTGNGFSALFTTASTVDEFEVSNVLIIDIKYGSNSIYIRASVEGHGYADAKEILDLAQDKYNNTCYWNILEFRINNTAYTPESVAPVFGNNNTIDVSSYFSEKEIAVFSNTSTVQGTAAIGDDGKTLVQNAIEALYAVPDNQRVFISGTDILDHADYVIMGGEFYVKTQTVQRTGDDVVLTLSVKQNSGSPFVVTINHASADYSVDWKGDTYTQEDIINGSAPEDLTSFMTAMENSSQPDISYTRQRISFESFDGDGVGALFTTANVEDENSVFNVLIVEISYGTDAIYIRASVEGHGYADAKEILDLAQDKYNNTCYWNILEFRINNTAYTPESVAPIFTGNV